MGSFVPATEAVVGVADRLFARVGASDNVARHMSTFHVEMTETANILAMATQRSFVVLDEIGKIISIYYIWYIILLLCVLMLEVNVYIFYCELSFSFCVIY